MRTFSIIRSCILGNIVEYFTCSLDWDVAATYDVCEDIEAVVPESECALSADGLRTLEHLLNSTAPNISVKELNLLCLEFAKCLLLLSAGLMMLRNSVFVSRCCVGYSTGTCIY